MPVWERDGKLVVGASGGPIECDTCPCCPLVMNAGGEDIVADIAVTLSGAPDSRFDRTWSLHGASDGTFVDSPTAGYGTELGSDYPTWTDGGQSYRGTLILYGVYPYGDTGDAAMRLRVWRYVGGGDWTVTDEWTFGLDDVRYDVCALTSDAWASSGESDMAASVEIVT